MGASDLGWRVVTTGHDGDGRAGFRSDTTLPARAGPGTARAAPIVSFEGWPGTVDDGAERGPVIVQGPGGLTVDALVVAPDSGWLVEPGTPPPGAWEAWLVVRGGLEVTVGSGSVRLGPGHWFLPQGQAYSARTSAREETRLVVTRAMPDPGVPAPVATSLDAGRAPGRVRRVVAGPGPAVAHDGEPAVAMVLGDPEAPGVAIYDVWQTGGPVRAADQGGDVPGPFSLEPQAGGLKLIDLQLKAVPEGTPQGDAGWHTTATVDVDVIVGGTVEMYLPDLPPVRLGPGDVLVQRGTNHLWHAIGDEPLRMCTVMIGLGPGR